MAKSRGRKFAEIPTPTNGVFDLTSVPTITNAKLQNSAMTLAGSSVSLGGTGVANTDALSEGSSNLYFTNARVQTFLGGGTLAGNVVVPDNRSIYLGSDSDFRMVHNTANTQLINATGALQITSNGGVTVTGATTFSADLTVDTNTLKVDSTNNRVGIGLTNPGHQLDVEGGANQYAIARFGSSTTDNEELTIGYWNASAGNGIPALAAGSSFGGLIQGGENGKLILGIRDNDATDSVQIISGGGNFMSDSTYDTVVANFQADGKVGIGTSQPIALTGNASPSLTISSNGPYILLQDANNANKVRYISNNTGEFQFGIVNDDGSTSKAEHMRIDSSGNVGIGVPAPDQKLMVKGTIEAVATNSANGWQLYTYTDNTFRLNYNGAGADEVTILSNGNVGIGTDSPNRKLDIEDGHMRLTPGYGVRWEDDDGTFRGHFATDTSYNLVYYAQSDGSNPAFVVKNSNRFIGIGESNPDAPLHITGNTPIISLDESDASQEYRIGSFGGTFAIYDSTDTEYRFAINGDGNVGIGTTSPTNLLQISGGSASDSRIQFTTDATGNAYADGFWVGVDNTQGYLLHRENTPLSFYTNAAKVMILDTEGNLGIGGSAAPSNYSGYHTLSVRTGTTGSILQLDGATSNHACMLVNNNGQLLVRSDQNNVASGSGILFQVDGSNRMFIDDNTLVRVNGPTRQAGDSSSGTKMYTGLCTGSFYSSTGYVVIETNIPGHNSSGNANMFSVSIKGFGYASTTEGIIDVNIGCYSGEGGFYERGYSGSNVPEQWVKEGIQFATNTSTGKLAIFCGGASSPVRCELAVTDFIQGYVNVNEDYATGWSMSIKTSTSGYNNFQTAIPRETAYPRFEAYTTSPFTKASGWTKVSASLSETTDEMGTYANGRFTPGVRGMYLISCGGYSSHSTQNQNDRMAWSFYKNGSLTIISGGNYSHGDSPLPNHTQILYLDENDYVELYAYSVVSCTWAHSSHAVWWHGMRIGSQT